jgi:hypothetical protein
MAWAPRTPGRNCAFHNTKLSRVSFSKTIGPKGEWVAWEDEEAMARVGRFVDVFGRRGSDTM